jgi:hypothetical protein
MAQWCDQSGHKKSTCILVRPACRQQIASSAWAGRELRRRHPLGTQLMFFLFLKWFQSTLSTQAQETHRARRRDRDRGRSFPLDRRRQSRRDNRAEAGDLRQPTASSFSFAQRTNSASKALIRRSSSTHCARASSTSSTMRGLKLAPPCSSISTLRKCSSFQRNSSTPAVR